MNETGGVAGWFTSDEVVRRASQRSPSPVVTRTWPGSQRRTPAASGDRVRGICRPRNLDASKKKMLSDKEI